MQKRLSDALVPGGWTLKSAWEKHWDPTTDTMWLDLCSQQHITLLERAKAMRKEWKLHSKCTETAANLFLVPGPPLPLLSVHYHKTFCLKVFRWPCFEAKQAGDAYGPSCPPDQMQSAPTFLIAIGLTLMDFIFYEYKFVKKKNSNKY